MVQEQLSIVASELVGHNDYIPTTIVLTNWPGGKEVISPQWANEGILHVFTTA